MKKQWVLILGLCVLGGGFNVAYAADRTTSSREVARETFNDIEGAIDLLRDFDVENQSSIETKIGLSSLSVRLSLRMDSCSGAGMPSEPFPKVRFKMTPVFSQDERVDGIANRGLSFLMRRMGPKIGSSESGAFAGMRGGSGGRRALLEKLANGIEYPESTAFLLKLLAFAKHWAEHHNDTDDFTDEKTYSTGWYALNVVVLIMRLITTYRGKEDMERMRQFIRKGLTGELLRFIAEVVLNKGEEGRDFLINKIEEVWDVIVGRSGISFEDRGMPIVGALCTKFEAGEHADAFEKFVTVGVPALYAAIKGDEMPSDPEKLDWGGIEDHYQAEPKDLLGMFLADTLDEGKKYSRGSKKLSDEAIASLRKLESAYESLSIEVRPRYHLPKSEESDRKDIPEAVRTKAESMIGRDIAAAASDESERAKIKPAWVRDGENLWMITLRVDDALALKIGLTIFTRALWEYVQAMLDSKNSEVAKDFHEKMRAFQDMQKDEQWFLKSSPEGYASMCRFDKQFDVRSLPKDYFSFDVERRLHARAGGADEQAEMNQAYYKGLKDMHRALHGAVIAGNLDAVNFDELMPFSGAGAVSGPPTGASPLFAWHAQTQRAYSQDAAHKPFWVARVADTALLKHPQGVFRHAADDAQWYAWRGKENNMWEAVTPEQGSILSRSANKAGVVA